MNWSKLAVAFSLAFLVTGRARTEEPTPSASDEPAKKYVEKTIFVPEWVTETKICHETRYRTETQQKEIVTYTCKQVTKEVPYEYNVWVRENRTETQNIEINTPVYRWEDQKYHIYVPSKMNVTRYRTKTECKENKLVCVQEPYQCEVDICVPVEQTRRVKVYETKTEKKAIPRTYETIVPQTRSKMVTVCYEEKVPETKKVPVEVCVPYTVDVEKKVRVCKMVPKTIQVPCE